VYESR